MAADDFCPVRDRQGTNQPCAKPTRYRLVVGVPGTPWHKGRVLCGIHARKAERLGAVIEPLAPAADNAMRLRHTHRTPRRSSGL